jgi:hypothetical protein
MEEKQELPRSTLYSTPAKSSRLKVVLPFPITSGEFTDTFKQYAGL